MKREESQDYIEIHADDDPRAATNLNNCMMVGDWHVHSASTLDFAEGKDEDGKPVMIMMMIIQDGKGYYAALTPFTARLTASSLMAFAEEHDPGKEGMN